MSHVSIGLHRPKDPQNIGAVLRAAMCYDVVQVAIATTNELVYEKGITCGTNVTKTHRHKPVYRVDSLNDVQALPRGIKTVVVEFLPDATPLPVFRHPKSAFYVFGPENGNVPDDVMERADHAVMIPTRFCLNLAMTVNVVLYDRLAKTSRLKESS